METIMNAPLNRAVEWVSADYQPLVLGGLVLLSLAVFFAAAWPKYKVLRLSAADATRFGNPLKRLGHVLRIVFAQSKLLKRAGPGWMHALIFWGFCILLLRAAQFFAIGFFPGLPFRSLGVVWDAYIFVKDIFVLLVTGAVLYALYRRLAARPPRLTLSGEGLLILALILLIMITDALFEAAFFELYPGTASLWSPVGYFTAKAVFNNCPIAAVQGWHNFAYWGHVTAILVFIDLLPRSKHFHIVTSFANVYFANVSGHAEPPARLDFEDESQETFGVTRIEEFSWKGLLDLHTCTECGRCDLVCPALNSGKPLSPKEFTVALRGHLNQVTPDLLGGGETPRPALAGDVIADETVWSCTTCGACEEECPLEIQYVNKMIDLRRGLVMMDSRFPRELNRAFKSLETNGNPWGFGRDSRADWAAELGVRLWDKAQPTEYLYFVGCNGSFDNRGKQVATAVVKLLQTAGVDFSILGKAEGCTGDPARRAGNEYLFDMLAAQNAATFRENGVTKVVTHCPHCFNALKNEYPAFGARLDVFHHSELLGRLIAEGKIAPGGTSPEKVVYHDSCYLGRHNKLYDAPRAVIAAGGQAAREPENSRERGACCGAGGARFLLEENTGVKMSHNRIDELMQTNPDTIAVSCPFCVLMLEDAVKSKNLPVKVKDISELLSRGETTG